MGILDLLFGKVDRQIEEPEAREAPSYWWGDQAQAEMRANEPGDSFFDGFL